MKKSKLILLIFTIVFVYSCNKDENLKVNELNSVKIIDMNNVGDNYDKLVLDIQSDPNLDIVIGDFKLEMREMKPAEGIYAENTIILEDQEKNNKTIIIDNNTQSIYVRHTDINEKYNYVLYGFKNSAHLDDMLKSEDYNIDMLTKSESYKKRLTQSSKLDFTSTRTSFVIKKPILTNKEEFLQSKTGHKLKCSVVEKEENYNSSYNNKRFSSRNWNLVIYKENSRTSTSSILDALRSSFKSLSSKEGSSWFNSRIMYANLHVSYKVVPNPIPGTTDDSSLLNNFGDYLNKKSVPKNRSTHSYMYLKRSSSVDDDGGVGAASDFYSGGYRMGVCRNHSNDFAHEVGHTLGADHFDSVVWDRSLGWWGWWGESVMHSVSNGSSWYANVQSKYYSSKNRRKVKRVLN